MLPVQYLLGQYSCAFLMSFTYCFEVLAVRTQVDVISSQSDVLPTYSLCRCQAKYSPCHMTAVLCHKYLPHYCYSTLRKTVMPDEAETVESEFSVCWLYCQILLLSKSASQVLCQSELLRFGDTQKGLRLGSCSRLTCPREFESLRCRQLERRKAPIVTVLSREEVVG